MRAGQNVSERRYTLTICAASSATGDAWWTYMVCGLPPGHDGPHHDIEYPVKWPGGAPGEVTT